jgi:glycosyltransferase involved in cell wall biosynthesis
MKSVKMLLGVCMLFASMTYIESYKENRIVVVIASYNNVPWYKQNLDSLFWQKYNNWHAIYIDDCSTDGTYEAVCNYVQQCGMQSKVTVIRNPVRLASAVGNHYAAIHTYCKREDIVVIVDGDDNLVPNEVVPDVNGQGVLTFINKVYQDESVWITYGQFRERNSHAPGFCVPYPPSVVARNEFRYYAHGPSHLRTFKAGLFMKIVAQDLQDHDGRFLWMSGDLAAMLPMLEMAQKNHFRFIPTVLLDYNDGNPLNNYRVSKAEEVRADQLIRSRKRYQPLEKLF